MDTGGGVSSELVLGKRLQEARRQAGLTQQQLCQRANLSYSTLAKIERGAIKSPSIFTIQSIATALQTSLDELVGASQGGSPSAKRISKNGVRFVYFDLNGCLVRFASRGFTQMAHDSGQSIDVVESIFWQYNDQVCRGEVSMDELNTALAERLGIMIDWQHYYLEAVNAMPGMEELVPWTADQYLVGIMSNTMPGLIDALRGKAIIPVVNYQAIVDSSVIHALKPEPKMYEIATQNTGVEASEILLVDDDRSNLMAARKAGWKTIWFDAYNPEDSIASIKSALEPAEAS